MDLDEKMVTSALCGVQCIVLTLSALYGHFSAYFPIPFRLGFLSCLANITVYACMLSVACVALYGTDQLLILGSMQINNFHPMWLLWYFLRAEYPCFLFDVKTKCIF